MNLGTRFISKDYSTVHNSHYCIFICIPVYYALNVQDRYFRINFTKNEILLIWVTLPHWINCLTSSNARLQCHLRVFKPSDIVSQTLTSFSPEKLFQSSLL